MTATDLPNPGFDTDNPRPWGLCSHRSRVRPRIAGQAEYTL